MTSHNLKVGDLVKLRSGGAVMTVIAVRTDEIEVCYWDDETGLQSWQLPPAALVKENTGATLRAVPSAD